MTFLYLKESLVSNFSENCTYTCRKYLTEQVVKWSENRNFFWLPSLYFYFRILPSKIVNHDVFLPIEEFPVASFCKSPALIPRKYMVEQGIRVSNWLEIFKSLCWHSSFFDLGQSNLNVSDKLRTVTFFSYICSGSECTSFIQSSHQRFF